MIPLERGCDSRGNGPSRIGNYHTKEDDPDYAINCAPSISNETGMALRADALSLFTEIYSLTTALRGLN
jgi:hypothetical protein